MNGQAANNRIWKYLPKICQFIFAVWNYRTRRDVGTPFTSRTSIPFLY